MEDIENHHHKTSSSVQWEDWAAPIVVWPQNEIFLWFSCFNLKLRVVFSDREELGISNRATVCTGGIFKEAAIFDAAACFLLGRRDRVVREGGLRGVGGNGGVASVGGNHHHSSSILQKWTSETTIFGLGLKNIFFRYLGHF